MEYKISSKRRILELGIEWLDEVLALVESSFEVPWTTKDIAYFLAHESGFCLGCIEENNKLLGYELGLRANENLDIVSLAVAPGERRKGIAKMLLQETLKKEGLRAVFVEVESTNFGAIKLYENCGFERIGLRPKYYAGRGDAIVMKRSVGR